MLRILATSFLVIKSVIHGSFFKMNLAIDHYEIFFIFLFKMRVLFFFCQLSNFVRFYINWSEQTSPSLSLTSVAYPVSQNEDKLPLSDQVIYAQARTQWYHGRSHNYWQPTL